MTRLWILCASCAVIIASASNINVTIIIIKNECHSNIIVDRLQGCAQSKKLRESESESRNSKVSFDRRGASPVVRTLEEFSSYNSNLWFQCRLHDNEIENFCVSMASSLFLKVSLNIDICIR